MYISRFPDLKGGMLDAFRGEGKTHAYLLNHDQARMAFPDLASLGTVYLLKKI